MKLTTATIATALFCFAIATPTRVRTLQENHVVNRDLAPRASGGIPGPPPKDPKPPKGPKVSEVPQASAPKPRGLVPRASGGVPGPPPKASAAPKASEAPRASAPKARDLAPRASGGVPGPPSKASAAPKASGGGGAASPKPSTAVNSRNDLTGTTVTCKAVTIVYARGTTEAGNVGTLTGPPFFDAVDQAMGPGMLAVQGVEYAADIPGFLAGGDAAGSMSMAKLVSDTLAKCPETKLVMSGYSQGAQLVHNAGMMLSAADAAKVNSVVMFGDPKNSTSVGAIPTEKVSVVCHDTDNICMGGNKILQAHLTYSMNATEAASFVSQKAGVKA